MKIVIYKITILTTGKSYIGEWYTTRVHKDGKYIAGRSFKLLKVEKIN